MQLIQQQGDVLLFQTTDDGDINVTSGLVEMSAGLRTAAYLSLFGGNEQDAGGSDKSQQWWGNVVEPDPARHHRSETQHLLQALPVTTANLRRIEDAIKRDLAWMVTFGAASSIDVATSIPSPNRIQIVIKVNAEGEESEFAFVENWKAATA